MWVLRPLFCWDASGSVKGFLAQDKIHLEGDKSHLSKTFVGCDVITVFAFKHFPPGFGGGGEVESRPSLWPNKPTFHLLAEILPLLNAFSLQGAPSSIATSSAYSPQSPVFLSFCSTEIGNVGRSQNTRASIAYWPFVLQKGQVKSNIPIPLLLFPIQRKLVNIILIKVRKACIFSQ